MNPFAIPPHDMVMPANAQFWLTIAWGTFAALTVLMFALMMPPITRENTSMVKLPATNQQA